MQRLKSLWADTSGATAIEYGLMVALLAICVITAVGLIGDPVNGLFGGVKNSFDQVETFMDD